MNYGNSKVGFVATYDEVPFEGRFEDFEAAIRFDPSTLDQASFKVNVTITSVNTDSPDRDEGMLEQDFFDASQYPSATFTSTAFAKSTNGDGYDVTGDLAIKGISKPISLNFNWEVSDNAARLHGQGSVKRTDFKVGTGDWEEDDTIGFDVQIVFDLGLQE
ncbi:MAG: YceI family protein [Arenicellales bacterium]|nr:YceI family protein [Arenicellales bacterium]